MDIFAPSNGPFSMPHQATNSKRAKPIPSLGNCPKAKAVSGLPTFIMILDMWMFPKIGVPENGWFIVEDPIKMDDLGVPLFLEIP